MKQKKQPAKPKEKTYSEKTISYVMPSEVVKALEENLMKDYGERTYTKTINICILNNKTLRDKIDKLEDECNQLYHENLHMKDLCGKITSTLTEMHKLSK